MDMMYILFMMIAALIGAAVTYFILHKKDGPQPVETSIDSEKDIQACKKELEQTKDKYESLLKEAQTKIAELDGQLGECLNGHLDESVKKQLEEINKLKKKIKDLGEELEDKEDDLDDCKKKLKNRTNECTELQIQLDKEVKVGKEVKEELEQLQSELETKQDELELKMESLRFVQEVVSAQPVNDSDNKELFSNVDRAVGFIKGELRDCVKSVFPEITKEDENLYFGAELNKWAIVTKKSWIQHKKAVAFVGEFSAGKTSIVNRILSQDNPNVPLLPVSTKATTAIPTYISGGVSTRYNFVTPDNVQKNISEETFKRVNKEVLDEIKGISSLIQYFVMTYKNDNLNNLSILDTPGFSSNDKEDAQRTIEVINECDALFWVFDVNAGTVNRTSIQLIKENLKKPLYVVINKVDTKAKVEVDKVEQLIRKRLEEDGLSVQKFIRFSAKAPLTDLMEVIQSVPKDKEQISYIAGLKDFINKKLEDLNMTKRRAYDKYNNLQEKCYELDWKYKNELDDLKENCEKAVEIPHFEVHFFSKDVYEMNEEEFKGLEYILKLIKYNNTRTLEELSEEQKEMKKKAQNAYTEWTEGRIKFLKMDDCKSLLDKLVKPFIR